MDPNHFGNNANLWGQNGGYFPPPMSPPFNSASPPFNGTSPPFTNRLSPGRSVGEYPLGHNPLQPPGLVPSGFMNYNMRPPDVSQGFTMFDKPMGFLQHPGENFVHTFPPPPPLTSMAGFLQRDQVHTSTPVANNSKKQKVCTENQKVHCDSDALSAFQQFNQPLMIGNQVETVTKQATPPKDDLVGAVSVTDDVEKANVAEFNLQPSIPPGSPVPGSPEKEDIEKTVIDQTDNISTNKERDDSNAKSESKETEVISVREEEEEKMMMMGDQSADQLCENTETVSMEDVDTENNVQQKPQDEQNKNEECNNTNQESTKEDEVAGENEEYDEESEEVCLLSPFPCTNDEDDSIKDGETLKMDDSNSIEGSLGEEEENSLQPDQKSIAEKVDDISGADVDDDQPVDAQTEKQTIGVIEKGDKDSGDVTCADNTKNDNQNEVVDKDLQDSNIPGAENKDTEVENKDEEMDTVGQGEKKAADTANCDGEETGKDSVNLSGGVTVKSEPVDDFFEGNHSDDLQYKIKIEPEDSSEDDFNGFVMREFPEKKKRKTGKQMKKIGPKSAKLRMPFEHGWKREVVIRNYEGGLTKDGKKSATLADTYYFTPDGRKLRSLVKVQEYLDSAVETGLNLDCFSFVRKPIYKEPYEMVRTANRHAGRKSGTFNSPSKEMLEMLNNSSPVSASSPKKQSKQVKKRGRRSLEKKLVDIKIPAQEMQAAIVKPAPKEEEDIKPPILKKVKLVYDVEDHLTINDSGLQTCVVKTSTVVEKHKNHLVLKSADQSLCSLNCPGLDGAPPSLQCGVCMCLFHPQCVNFIGSTRDALFICLRCKDSVKRADPSMLKDASPTHPDALVMKPSIWTKQKLEEFVKSKDQKVKQEDCLEIKITGVMSMVQNSPPLVSSQTSTATAVTSSGPLRSMLNQVPAVTPISLIKATPPPPPPLVKAPTARRTRESSTPMGPPSILQPAPMSLLPSNTKMIVARLPMGAVPTLTAAPSQTLGFPRFAVPTSPGSSPGASPSHSPKIQVINQQDGSQKCQLLTLPMGVVKKINPSQPLAIKLNNQTYMIPPSCFVPTSTGFRIMLPANTLPVTASTKLKTSSVTSTVSDTSGSNALQAAVSRAVDIQQKPFNETDSVSQSPSLGDKSDDSGTSTDQAKRPRRSVRIKKLDQSMVCHCKTLHAGFDTLMLVFKYLTTAELLRASRVCRTWRNIISQITLWTHVKLKDSCISDWESAANHFIKFNTKRLDMRGLLHREDRNRTWHQMTAVLRRLTSIVHINFGQAPAIILQHVAEKMTNLEVLTAEWITDMSGPPQMWSTKTKIDLGKFAHLSNLKELRLRGLCGLVLPAFAFSGGISEFEKLKNLKILSLTTLKDVPDIEFAFLEQMKHLEVLEIGDCTTWKAGTYKGLSNLQKLHTLRLENGSESADSALAEALKDLKMLENLELIMFVIGNNLASVLPQLVRVKTLSVWPDLTTPQAAVVNTSTLEAVSKLVNLKTLDWGIMPNNNSSVILSDEQGENSQPDSVENKDGGNGGDLSSGAAKKSDIECIPFLPSNTTNENAESDVSMLPEYISIDQLMDKLCTFLPKAHIRVFRVPVYSPKKDT